MLKNYLKTILRNLQRNRGFTLINVVGLSLGLAAFVAINQYVRYETSFDSYHTGSERMYRIGMDLNFGDGNFVIPFMGAPPAVDIKNDFPQIEASTRLYAGYRREYFVKLGDTEFKEPEMSRLYGDVNFFEFFGIELLQGNPEEALNGPNLVVITESMAEKYFGSDWNNQEVLGTNVSMDDHPVLQISGVSEDVPGNTHFSYHFLVSGLSTREWKDPYWFSNAIYHYFRSQPGVDMDAFIAQLDERAPDYLASDMKDFLGASYADYFADESRHFNFFYQPVRNIHLTSHYELELAENGNETYVQVFSWVSVLVLLMAAVNFMNLTTVAGLKRHKEVAVRKVLGSVKIQLMFQFLLESALVVTFSMILGITLLQLLAPLLNAHFQIEIVPPLEAMLPMIGKLMLGAMLLGMMAGLYPAILLSGLKPTAILKGGKNGNRKVGFFRNALIVFQFTVSLALIIGMGGIQAQLNHLRTTDLGYDKDQVMIIQDANVLGHNLESFRLALLDNAAISAATLSGFVPIGSNEYGISGLDNLEDESDLTVRFRTAYVDEYYLDTYGLEITSGRGLSSDFGNERDKMVVNESFLKSWGWEAEESLGKRFVNVGDRREYSIIGVMKDFQTFNMKVRNEPLMLTYAIDSQAVAFRFTAENFESTREHARQSWEKFTDKPFSYSMANERFEAVFANESRVSELFVMFSALAVFIGAIGLLGVASFVISRRSKEVGIRKVLGASLPELLGTLSRSFMLLIVIASAIAVPVSWYFLGDWLSQYAFQASLSWWLFGVPIAAVGLLAFAIIGVQIWKVAIINPIKSLRYE